MSLWAEYIKERNGMGSIETEFGFMTFGFPSKEECFIEDCYIVPAHREKGHGKVLLKKIEEIAKQNGCKYLTSFVIPSVNSTASVSMLAQLRTGFKIWGIYQNKIAMRKELV